MARRATLAVVIAALIAVGAARADGDPASDYLLSRATFIPFDDGIPPAYARQVFLTVREANVRGYTIRVAIVGRAYDMGSVTVLFTKPKQYARFLGTELRLAYKDKLLVVMPNGLAVSRNGKAAPREQAIVDRIAVPGRSGAALASAATTAVTKLAAGAGVLVPRQPLAASPPAAASPKRNNTRDRLIIAAAVAAAALVVASFLLVRRRRGNLGP